MAVEGAVGLSLAHALRRAHARMINEERDGGMSRVVAVPINTRYNPSARQSSFFRPRDTMRRIRVLLLVLLAGCMPGSSSSAPAPSAGTFRVAIMGDMPYQSPADPKQDSIMAAYHAVLDKIAKENVAFVVHIGDITGATCSDSSYTVRLREFSAMPHPFVYTFGDNEWTDCARDGGKDPIERLAKLREMFTQGNTSLGRRTMPLERQSAQPASLAWLRDGFATATRDRKRGVAVFMQANSGLTTITRAETYGNPNFHALLMTVDPASPNLFRFEPLAVPRNGPR